MSAELKREPEYLAPSELAARWGNRISVQALAQWRTHKRGPVYRKFVGRILYDLADIERYEAECRWG